MAMNHILPYGQDVVATVTWVPGCVCPCGTALSDVTEVAALKGRFNDIHVIGSGDLARSLLEADLVDRLNLFLYPLTFGSGKRLFADGTGVPRRSDWCSRRRRFQTAPSRWHASAREHRSRASTSARGNGTGSSSVGLDAIRWVMWAQRMDGQPGGEAEGHPFENGVDYH
jgi:hypothetical protein